MTNEHILAEFREKFPYSWIEFRDDEMENKMQQLEAFWLSKLALAREQAIEEAEELLPKKISFERAQRGNFFEGQRINKSKLAVAAWNAYRDETVSRLTALKNKQIGV